MNPLKFPISGIAGIAVIVLYCAFTFTSWGLYPEAYSPVNNWLSDLGNRNVNLSGAAYYNWGCILTGVALFPFFFGLYKWHTDENWRKISIVITQVVGVLAGYSLVMIGVFPEDVGNAHNLWSSVFFVLNLAVLVLISISLFTHPKYIKPVAYYCLAVAAINLAFLFISGSPILEWFTVFTALGYVGLMVYNMFKAFT
jgi:hypothetical membrane protein